MFRHIILANNIFPNIYKFKNYHLNPPKSKNQRGSALRINDENRKCSEKLDQQNIYKNSKTQKIPPSTPKNQKTKNELSSDLMIKMQNVQTQNIRNLFFFKINSKYYPVKPLKPQIK